MSSNEKARCPESDNNNACPVERDAIAIWDDIMDLVAEDDVEHGESSAADRQWSKHVDVKVKARVAELRRRLTPMDVPIKRGVTIPPQILALDRDAVVAQLEILRQSKNVRYAHRELTSLSDNNLRILLTIAIGSKKG
jgi:hypothetical protein